MPKDLISDKNKLSKVKKGKKKINSEFIKSTLLEKIFPKSEDNNGAKDSHVNKKKETKAAKIKTKTPQNVNKNSRRKTKQTTFAIEFCKKCYKKLLLQNMTYLSLSQTKKNLFSNNLLSSDEKDDNDEDDESSVYISRNSSRSHSSIRNRRHERIRDSSSNSESSGYSLNIYENREQFPDNSYIPVDTIMETCSQIGVFDSGNKLASNNKESSYDENTKDNAETMIGLKTTLSNTKTCDADTIVISHKSTLVEGSNAYSNAFLNDTKNASVSVFLNDYETSGINNIKTNNNYQVKNSNNSTYSIHTPSKSFETKNDNNTSYKGVNAIENDKTRSLIENNNTKSNSNDTNICTNYYDSCMADDDGEVGVFNRVDAYIAAMNREEDQKNENVDSYEDGEGEKRGDVNNKDMHGDVINFENKKEQIFDLNLGTRLGGYDSGGMRNNDEIKDKDGDDEKIYEKTIGLEIIGDNLGCDVINVTGIDSEKGSEHNETIRNSEYDIEKETIKNKVDHKEAAIYCVQSKIDINRGSLGNADDNEGTQNDKEKDEKSENSGDSDTSSSDSSSSSNSSSSSSSSSSSEDKNSLCNGDKNIENEKEKVEEVIDIYNEEDEIEKGIVGSADLNNNDGLYSFLWDKVDVSSDNLRISNDKVNTKAANKSMKDEFKMGVQELDTKIMNANSEKLTEPKNVKTDECKDWSNEFKRCGDVVNEKTREVIFSPDDNRGLIHESEKDKKSGNKTKQKEILGNEVKEKLEIKVSETLELMKLNTIASEISKNSNNVLNLKENCASLMDAKPKGSENSDEKSKGIRIVLNKRMPKIGSVKPAFREDEKTQNEKDFMTSNASDENRNNVKQDKHRISTDGSVNTFQFGLDRQNLDDQMRDHSSIRKDLDHKKEQKEREQNEKSDSASTSSTQSSKRSYHSKISKYKRNIIDVRNEESRRKRSCSRDKIRSRNYSKSTKYSVKPSCSYRSSRSSRKRRSFERMEYSRKNHSRHRPYSPNPHTQHRKESSSGFEERSNKSSRKYHKEDIDTRELKQHFNLRYPVPTNFNKPRFGSIPQDPPMFHPYPPFLPNFPAPMNDFRFFHDHQTSMEQPYFHPLQPPAFKQAPLQHYMKPQQKYHYYDYKLSDTIGKIENESVNKIDNVSNTSTPNIGRISYVKSSESNAIDSATKEETA